MNGEPLPVVHGAPLRLIVPGWAGDHWMKWLVRLSPQAEPQKGFYMETAYRYPLTPGAPGVAFKPEEMSPVTELFVKSNITTAPKKARAGHAYEIRGFAFSGAPDIAKVEISDDDGATWHEATLDPRHDAVRLAALVASLDAVARRRGAHLRARDGQPRQRSAARCGLESERISAQRLALRRRRGDGMKRVDRHLFCAGRTRARRHEETAAYDPNLPVLGTKFHSLPAGNGRQLVEASCFPCHSADILVQQRLTEKQWTATVDKMIRWGAVVKDSGQAGRHRLPVEKLRRGEHIHADENAAGRLLKKSTTVVLTYSRPEPSFPSSRKKEERQWLNPVAVTVVEISPIHFTASGSTKL